jgi:hypothetical protein
MCLSVSARVYAYVCQCLHLCMRVFVSVLTSVFLLPAVVHVTLVSAFADTNLGLAKPISTMYIRCFCREITKNTVTYRTLPYSPLVNNVLALRRDIGIVKDIFIQRLQGFRGLAKIPFGGWRTHTCAGTVTHTTVTHTTDAHIYVQAQAHQHTCTCTNVHVHAHTHTHLYRHWLG